LKQLPQYHRKSWEWCYVYEALLEHGCLVPGKKGLGFGVGREPLVSLFASHGCEIKATDQDFETAHSMGWVQALGPTMIAELNSREICDPDQFRSLVSYEYVDMNHLTDKYSNTFDFNWSVCSFEHLGSLSLGKQFILNQMKWLKPGGVAVHTTEYNLSSNENTIDNGPIVLFRRKDIEELVKALRNEGYSTEIDYSLGNGKIESYVDVYPYTHFPHIRLQIYDYVATVLGLIIKKGPQ
jgi:hypothetical protein